MIELRQMRQFIAVAEEGNFHRAAERLFMTQPPLSMAIRKLEEDLGCMLLERKHKGFSLTPAGALFLHEAKQLVRLTEAMTRQVKEVADGTKGHLRVSFVGSALYGNLPNLIRKFRKKFPGVRLELRVATSGQQYDMLRKNETDVAILNDPPLQENGFEALTFDRDRLCMALPLAHRLAAPGVELAGLKDQAFIIWPRDQGRSFYDKVIELCGRAGFSPNIVQEAHQMQAVLSLVAVEAGLALVPQSMSGFRPGEVAYFPIEDHRAAFDRSLLRRKDVENAAVRHFIEMVGV